MGWISVTWTVVIFRTSQQFKGPSLRFLLPYGPGSASIPLQTVPSLGCKLLRNHVESSDGDIYDVLTYGVSC